MITGMPCAQYSHDAMIIDHQGDFLCFIHFMCRAQAEGDEVS